jgi:hypothetical protein
MWICGSRCYVYQNTSRKVVALSCAICRRALTQESFDIICLDTRDVNADGLKKLAVPRTLLYQLMDGCVLLNYDCEGWTREVLPNSTQQQRSRSEYSASGSQQSEIDEYHFDLSPLRW